VICENQWKNLNWLLNVNLNNKVFTIAERFFLEPCKRKQHICKFFAATVNMDINTQIIPKKSLGGIALGEQIDNVISRLSTSYKIIRHPSCTVINEGLITAYHDTGGKISSLSCNSIFKGGYLDRLWPGMSVLDVIKIPTRKLLGLDT
jgi:hypothetical protein